MTIETDDIEIERPCDSTLASEPPQTPQALTMGRREPEEEFFFLAILALKMIHTENGEAEYIYEINGPKLF